MRTLIIEPDIQAVHRLEEMLIHLDPAIKIVNRCASVAEARQWFETNALPDLVFSVVQLPDGLSFDLFKKMKQAPPVIFTCAYDNYAFEAFKVSGVHYLKKPIQEAELKEALNRYKNLFVSPKKPNGDEPLSRTSAKYFQHRFVVHVGKQMKLIEAKDVAYFYTENKVVYLNTTSGAKFTIEFTIEQLENLLDPKFFFRINRQFIINIVSIMKMVPAPGSRLKLFLKPDSPREIITSSERTAHFRKWLVEA